MKCTIRICDAPATVLAIRDRPASAVAGTTYWHGHMETPYCAAHAIERLSVEGFDRFEDTWTLRPIRAERKTKGVVAHG